MIGIWTIKELRLFKSLTRRLLATNLDQGKDWLQVTEVSVSDVVCLRDANVTLTQTLQ